MQQRVSQIGTKWRSKKWNLTQKYTYPDQPSCSLKEVAHPVTCPAVSLPFCYSFPRAGDIPHFYRPKRWATVTMAKAAAQLGPRSVHWPDLHLSPHHIHYTSRGLLPPALLGAHGDAVQQRNGLASEQFPALTHSTARSSQQMHLF